MEMSNRPEGFLVRLLEKTGGWYITFITLLAQTTASTTMLLGVAVEMLNAEYSKEARALVISIEAVSVLVVNVLLLTFVFLATRKAFTRLNIWRREPELFEKEDSPQAWQNAHNITWKYGIASMVVSLVFFIIPKTVYLSRSGLANQDQIIYGIIAGFVSLLGFVPLSAILLDEFLNPVRQLLLPKDFSHQLSGLSKIRLLYKILAIVIFSLFTIALLIAPIGYHQTTRVLYTEIGSSDVITELQTQSILVSGFAIIFSAGLTYLFSRSISNPLQQLLLAFQKVENGDLNTRVSATSTDEISKLAIYFNRMVSRLQELQMDLENRVEDRAAQLKAINEVGRVATSTLDPDEIIHRVVNLITEEFGYYFSAIYLVDNSKKWLELKDASGEAGRILKESEHRLEIDKPNTISLSIRSRQAQVTTGANEKASRFDYSLLPYTRSEISLPLFVGDRILGALDVHSSQEDAFSEQDIETLQNMANQVAISLDNARLFQETNENLQEMRHIQKQYLQDAWIDASLPGGEMTLAIGNSGGAEASQVEVPITLREQIIGQIRLEGNKDISPEDQNWLTAIATQTALALENARLIDESQSSAIREKFVTEITNKIWASTSIDGVLQTAVRELGRILDATEATIELNSESE
jgi:GAF domain-containing protein/HAMP domain-containing protein